MKKKEIQDLSLIIMVKGDELMDFFISDKMNTILRYFTAIMEIIILGLLIFFFIIKKENELPTSTNMNTVSLETKKSAEEIIEEVPKEEKNFYVDIKGAVKNPGVYQVSSNNIINDIITLAGGLKSNASTKNLNLSKKVSEEMVIYIYTTTELKNISANNQSNDPCVCNTETISACLDNQASIIISKDEVPKKEPDKNDSSTDKKDDTEVPNTPSNETTKININTATKEELTKLTGIGDAKAASIIEYRTTNGSFKSPEDLMKVSGISEKIYEKIKDNITI